MESVKFSEPSGEENLAPQNVTSKINRKLYETATDYWLIINFCLNLNGNAWSKTSTNFRGKQRNITTTEDNNFEIWNIKLAIITLLVKHNISQTIVTGI